MHDAQEHKGEHTDLSKLRKGGRAKKDCGTVKKYKAGGSVGVYGAKKSSGDLDSIEKAKDIKPAKAAAPSKAAVKPNFQGSDVTKEKSKPAGHKDPYIKSKQSGKAAAAPSGAKGPDAFKKGGKVKKAMGGAMTAVDAKLAALDKQRQMEKMKRARALPPSMQSQLINQDPSAAGLSSGAMGGGMGSAVATPMPATDQMGNATNMPTQKRGGKVKRKC